MSRFYPVFRGRVPGSALSWSELSSLAIPHWKSFAKAFRMIHTDENGDLNTSGFHSDMAMRFVPLPPRSSEEDRAKQFKARQKRLRAKTDGVEFDYARESARASRQRSGHRASQKKAAQATA